MKRPSFGVLQFQSRRLQPFSIQQARVAETYSARLLNSPRKIPSQQGGGEKASDYVPRRSIKSIKFLAHGAIVLFKKGIYMATTTENPATDILLSSSSVPIDGIATAEQTNDPLIDFEATAEFRQQFQTWKTAKLKEVLAYLHNNWGLKEVTIDRLVIMPQFQLPDRQNRNLYGQVAPGQAFADKDGNVVPHPTTGQPMLFTVWRRVDPPVADIPAEKTEASGTENAKPEIEPVQPAATAV